MREHETVLVKRMKQERKYKTIFVERMKQKPKVQNSFCKTYEIKTRNSFINA